MNGIVRQSFYVRIPYFGFYNGIMHIRMEFVSMNPINVFSIACFCMNLHRFYACYSSVFTTILTSIVKLHEALAIRICNRTSAKLKTIL